MSRIRDVIRRLRRHAGGPAVTVFTAAVMAGVMALVGGPQWSIVLASIVGAAGALWGQIQRAESAETIADLNRQIADSITGGGSFCYLETGLGDGKSDHGILAVVRQGDYPLYDVTLRIVDLDKINGTPTMEQLVGDVRTVGNLGVRQVLALESFAVPPGGLRWNIFITARNGNFTQRLRVRRVSGRWASAMNVSKLHANRFEVLMERVDDDYPRDDNDNPVW